MKEKIFLILCLMIAMPAWASDTQTKAASKANPDIQYQDPNADRIGFNSTAEVLPKGKWSFNDYDVGLLQVSWGVAKDLELSFTTTVPVLQAVIVPSIKWQIIDTNKVRFALQGYVGVLTFFGPWEDAPTIVGGGLAGLLDIRVGKNWGSLVSIGARFVGGTLIWDNSAKDSLLGYQINADGVFRVSKRVKLFLGLSFDHAFISDDSGKNFSGIGSFGLQYGVRIYGTHFAADLGLVRPIFGLDSGDIYKLEYIMKYMPIGYPFLSFTYKF